MNPKTLLVAVSSAVFAAGLTYWALSPVRNGRASMSKVSAAPAVPPPLVISTAGPESTPPRLDPAPPLPFAKPSAKPSPAGEPIAVAVAPLRVEQPPAQVAAAVPSPRQPEPEPVVAPPPAPPVATATAPPARVALNPPKEIDRAEPAVLHDRESRGPNSVTIDQGTLVTVRIGETLSVQKNLTGDTFFATLDQPLVAGGFVIAEKGARVEGKIVEVDKAGRMAGTSRLSLELTQINTSDGQRVHLQTATYTKDGADRNHKNDAAKIGGGAVLGAVIGAAAGGGKGAGVGAGVGGAAGAGAVLLSGGRNVTIPVETKISFRIDKPVMITERVIQ